MAKLLKEDLIKSHIAFAKRLVAEGIDIENLTDDNIEEGVLDYFKTITPEQKRKFAQAAIDSNDTGKMYDAIINCFQFTTKSLLVQKALKQMSAENLKAYLERGLKYNFTGFLKARPGLNNATDVVYNPSAQAGSFGSTPHASGV